jgi:hypothetical protein
MPGMRNALALWRQQLDDTQEDEILIRQIVVNHVVPLLAEQVRLARAFDFDDMINWFTGRDSVNFDGEYKLRVTTELEGVLKTNHRMSTISGKFDSRFTCSRNCTRRSGTDRSRW